MVYKYIYICILGKVSFSGKIGFLSNRFLLVIMGQPIYKLGIRMRGIIYNLQVHWPLTSVVPLGQAHVNPGATFVLVQTFPPVHLLSVKQASKRMK